MDGPRRAEALGQRSVVLIGNHGACFVCPSLEEATVKAIALESSARVHYEARVVGGHEMPEAEAARAKKACHKYFIPMMWEANYRRLRRTDADLFDTLAA